MSYFKTPLEIYKLLKKSNCRQCNMPTCLSFADAVMKGKKIFAECPHLEAGVIEQQVGKIPKRLSMEEQQQQNIEQLKKQVAAVGFSTAAERLGSSLSDGKLKVKSMGKDFIVDKEGNITSDCHVISWVTIPLLNYIISCRGTEPSGKWVPFRELKSGEIRQPLFGQGCEKPLKQLADTQTELFFEHIMYVLAGRPAVTEFASDLSFVLQPLPKVPVLLSYCRADDDIESNFSIFFDSGAEDNLNIESIHMLVTGMVTMFAKMSLRHG